MLWVLELDIAVTGRTGYPDVRFADTTGLNARPLHVPAAIVLTGATVGFEIEQGMSNVLRRCRGGHRPDARHTNRIVVRGAALVAKVASGANVVPLVEVGPSGVVLVGSAD